MTTAMGVVNMNNISPHKSLPNLPTITNDSSINAVDNDRREIIIIRKKLKLNQVDMKMPIIKMEPDSSTSNNNNNINVSTSRGGRKKPPPAPGSHQPPPLAVARRNARERNRVKQVNNGFANLRSRIPMSIAQAYSQDSSGRNSKKLSKVETLRMAVDYIRSLQRLLSMDDDEREESSERISLATPSSNSPGSPVMILPDSPLSPDTSSRASSYQPTSGYFYEEDTATPGGEDASPVLIEDEEMSNVDPASPIHSRLSYQYHRIPTSNTLIQLVNSPVENIKPYPTTLQYVTSDIQSRDLDSGMISAVHSQPLLQSHAYVTEDGVIYSETSNEDLAPVPLSSSPSRLQVPSSLSPAVYSDHSLSPSGKNDTKQSSFEDVQRIYLPSFSSSLKPSTLHNLSGVTDTVIHQSYSSSLQYTLKKELDDNIYVQESDISGNSDVLTGMMTWWDQDHRLRQPTTSS